MKKFLTVLTGVALAATMAVGFVGCGGNDNDDKGKGEKLADGMFDITLSAGMDTRLKLEIKDGGYLITYNDIARNEYISVASSVNINTSTTNVFTMEYENRGTENVYVSLEFQNAEGKTGYGGGDKAPGEVTDVVNLSQCHQYGTGTPLGTVTYIQMFFDSGWSEDPNAWMNLYSGTIFIKSIKLSYEEPAKGPELPDDSYNKLSTTMGDLFDPSAWDESCNLTTDNDTKTITRTREAGADGDYSASGQAYLNITNFSAQCEKIVITLGADTKFNMLMIQLQDDDGEIAKLIPENAVNGATKLIIDLTAEQATRFAASSKQYFIIWLDANSGNGLGKMVIENVEFYTTQEITEQPITPKPEQPEEPSGNNLSTTMGDLWYASSSNAITTDNDSKTVTRTKAPGESGDYAGWVGLNMVNFSADCRKIVISLGEDTSFNAIMIQVQPNGTSIYDEQFYDNTALTITIELTADQAQAIAGMETPHLMIWLNPHSGNETGKLVIAGMEFFGSTAE